MSTAAVEPGLSFEQIRARLSHRFPFHMVDRVLVLESGKTIDAIKHVTGNEICFLGHFPDKAVMPGVLILEAMAQALSLLHLASREADSKQTLYLGRADVQFLRPVQPGDTLALHAELLKQVTFGSVGKVSASVDGVCVARGEISLGVEKDG